MVAVVTKWHPERVATLARLMAQGLSYRQIGQRMGESATSCRGAAQRHGLQRPERLSRGEPWPREDYDILTAMLAEGKRYWEIGQRLDRTFNQVRSAVDRLGLTDQQRWAYRRRPDWPELEPIIIDCIEAELMNGPQIITRLATHGVTMTNTCLHNHLREMDPSLRQRIKRNAQRSRNARLSIKAKRRAAKKRQQREAA